MIIAIIAKDFDHAYNRLRVAGIRADVDDGEGNPVKPEYIFEKCSTPLLLCSDTQVAFAIDIDFSRVDKIPENETPNFEVVWREDDVVPRPWPSVTTDCEPWEENIFGEDGNPTGEVIEHTTRIQGVTRIV